jgi:hypothetical protein
MKGRSAEGGAVEGVRIILAGGWVAMMLTYLLGDVLRVFAGSFTPGEMAGRTASEWMWVAAAAVLAIPILMVVLSLIVPYPAIRWLSIAFAIFMVLFNLIGLPYPTLVDNVLIVFSFLFNALIVWYAWTWTETVAP